MKLQLLLLVLCSVSVFFVFGDSHGHTCAHDKISSHVQQTDISYVRYENHPHEAYASTPSPYYPSSPSNPAPSSSTSRRLLTNTYQNIRFYFYYSDLSALNATKQDYVKNVLVPEAARRLSLMIKVVPVSGNLNFPRQCLAKFPNGQCHEFESIGNSTCGEVNQIPASHVGNVTVCETQNNCVDIMGGPGLPDTDVIVYVRANQTATCPIGDAAGVIAYASGCRWDQYDRPIAGYINLCPAKVSTYPDDYEQLVLTVMHEMTHLLGWSNARFAWYRDITTGNPWTGRDQYGFPNGTKTDGIYNPSTNVVAPGTERGKAVTRLVTPALKSYSRSYFNCPDLPGLEIEDQGGSGTVATHPEKRLLQNEVMTGSASFTSVYSSFTLALLLDTGYYQIDNSHATPLVWAKNAGCGYIRNKCVQNGVANNTLWCDTNGARGCIFDNSAWGRCQLGNWVGLPSQFQYFSNSQLGGAVEIVDFCPFVTAYTNSKCNDIKNDHDSDSNYYGEKYGANSRCFVSNLVGDIYSADSNEQNSGCYRYACNSGGTLTITLYSTSGPVDVLCSTNNQIISNIPGFKNTITCPSNISEICVGFTPLPVDSTGSAGSCPTCTEQGSCYQGACACVSGYHGTTCADEDFTLLDNLVELTLSEYNAAGLIQNISSIMGISQSDVHILSFRAGKDGTTIVVLRFATTAQVADFKALAVAVNQGLVDSHITYARVDSTLIQLKKDNNPDDGPTTYFGQSWLTLTYLILIIAGIVLFFIFLCCCACSKSKKKGDTFESRYKPRNAV